MQLLGFECQIQKSIIGTLSAFLVDTFSQAELAQSHPGGDGDFGKFQRSYGSELQLPRRRPCGFDEATPHWRASPWPLGPC